jgi:hypothetical protein
MTAPTTGRRPMAVQLVAIGLLAAAVTGALYAFGTLHAPNYNFSLFGQNELSVLKLKSLLATAAFGLAVVQVLLGLWLYRRLPLAGRPPRPVPVTHRVVGVALFTLTVPIAVHCMLAYGVVLGDPRVAIHSLAGCLFYGAFTAKVLFVQSRRLPGWTLPTAGATLAVLMTVLWYTSAVWYFNGFKMPFA